MISPQPEIRYFIPCWKEPTIVGSAPSAHEILSTIQVKEGHAYPAWQRSFFVLVLITNLHGPCGFRIEIRLEELEQEILVQQTDPLTIDVGNDPLRIQTLSIMIKPTQLPKPGVYHVVFVWQDTELAKATVHAR
jgi:hypothetical protein